MTRIGFIGAGNMARALILAIKKDYPEIIASDKDPARVESLDVNGTTNNQKVVDRSDVVFLCVKPQIVDEVLNDLKIGGQIIVSIAAGVTISRIQDIIGNKKIIRVMPNTPCLVSEMTGAYSVNPNVTEDDKKIVFEILSKAGVIYEVSEELLDPVTGLSGSGPAFVAKLIEAFSDAGVNNGLSKEISYGLTLKTFIGTARLLKQMTPEELVNMVSSPNDTTVAGREVLENSDVFKIINDTISRATERSKELGK